MTKPLYARVLGEAWTALPEPIRAMHDVIGDRRASGLADVERGRGLIPSIVALIVGFPSAGRSVPVDVRFTTDLRGELWQRTFADKSFASYQFADADTAERVVFERLGLITIALHLVLDGARLDVVPLRWRLLGIPLPRALLPIGETYEAVDAQGRFTFHVEIAHPWFGLIVRYRGFLIPV